MFVCSAIKVKWDSTVGRHVVADRDIAPGEVVFLESPIGETSSFSSDMDPDPDSIQYF